MRRSKYRAIPTTVDGIRFASKAEARRYSELQILKAAGEISELTLQPRYRIEVQGRKICDYVADFGYFNALGRYIVEDVKGVLTPVYKLKKKLVKACWGIDIEEVKR